jgi:ribosome maturation protein Sdo1
MQARQVVNTIYIDDKVRDYIVDLVSRRAIRRRTGSISPATFNTALRRARRST